MEPVVIEHVEHAGVSYTVVSVDLRAADLDLYATAVDIHAVRARVAAEGREVVVATNGGIFGEGGVPLGLTIGKGGSHEINRADGDGNFYLKPNGVFWIDADGAHTAPTERYAPNGDVRLATQSGPMLLVDGAPHPEFRPQSSNFLLRSGVCASDAHTVRLVISDGGVRFHDFATLLRDRYRCRDALYLDGVVSVMDLPDARIPTSMTYGSILVVTRPIPAPGL